MYAYIQWDVLVRFMRFVGYKVKWVMNVTDVGHMTSDEDSGEDKMEKGAKREGISVWELAERYIQQFRRSMELVNIQSPNVLCRATEHIDDQIKLASLIEKNGFAYRTKMGLVFDTSKFADYGKFANLKFDEMKRREDVEVDPDKKRPWDFFLWVTGNPNHIMKWESPWGEGYPGWHIECTAMSTKYLGEKFDIHTGGIEHIPVHHTNEIAQGFAAFGRQTANYWLHNAHLTGEGGVKMSKSLGNFFTVEELVDKGFDPIAFRYLALTSHYRKGLSFSFEALQSAQSALKNVRELVNAAREQKTRTVLSAEKDRKREKLEQEFIEALADDLNTSVALAVLWKGLKSNIPSEDKYDLALAFDEVLGLNLNKPLDGNVELPQEILDLVEQRNNLRREGNYAEADRIREEIENKGYIIEDRPTETVVKKR
jgi:cysteinyl-tRNA synthetase